MHIVLVEPEIPQNTGNIGRLCVATGSTLHLVEPLGFELTDKYLKRAGLDYWQYVDVRIHKSWEDFLKTEQPARLSLFTTKASETYTKTKFTKDQYVVFGSESKGLADKIHKAYPNDRLKIPLISDKVRSLNVANAVSIVVYEALRQFSEE